MALRSEDFDFLSNLSSLWAMVLGAVLATVGGFATSQLEWHIEKRRRQQQAALLFGEVFSTLGYILRIAHGTYGIGDPFGPITLRMLRSARSEIDMYNRNRETLYDLHDASLRARIHTLVLRIGSPLDGVLDTSAELQLIETQLRTPGIPAEHRAELEARRERIAGSRQGSYDFAMETAQSIPAMVKDLELLAGRPIGAAPEAPGAASG